MTKKAATKFADLAKTQVPLLSELLNETFIVHGYSKMDTPLGIKCTVETDRGTYATFSEVLEQQLEMAQTNNAFPLEVTMRQRKRYYTFE